MEKEQYDKFKLYTCGCADLGNLERLLEIMDERDIEILVDVRSVPYSIYFQSFNKENIEEYLRRKGKRYMYMGDRLGGKVVKEQVAKGIKKVKDLLEYEPFREGMRELYKVCSSEKRCLIMCVEKKPEECHRFLAIGYLFVQKVKGSEVINIVQGEDLDSKKTLEKLSFKGKQYNLNGFSEDYKEKIIIQCLKAIYEEDEQEAKSRQWQPQNNLFGGKNENIYNRIF